MSVYQSLWKYKIVVQSKGKNLCHDMIIQLETKTNTKLVNLS